MGFFTGAADALQAALVEQEKQRRQAFLDSLAAQDRTEKERANRQNEQLRGVQIENAKLEQEGRAADLKAKAAERVASVLSPGQAVDASTADALTQGGMAGLIEQQPGQLASRSITGVAQATQKAPGLSDVVFQQHAERPDQTVFKGTYKQLAAKQPKLVPVQGVGLVKINPDGTTEIAQAAAPKQVPGFSLPPGGTRYDSEGNVIAHAPDRAPKAKLVNMAGVGLVRYDPDGTATVVQPAATKPGKSPDQIAAEAEARARGTAQGKKSVAGSDSGGLFSLLGNVFASHNLATAGAAAGPKPGDTKTFPNGAKAVWDGTGWVKQ